MGESRCRVWQLPVSIEWRAVGVAVHRVSGQSHPAGDAFVRRGRPGPRARLLNSDTQGILRG
jgi:hypothetical protein